MFIKPFAAEMFQLTLPERGATQKCCKSVLVVLFQLTLPERGATEQYLEVIEHLPFQLTLPERGATNRGVALQRKGYVSTHAPRAGSDSR